MKDFDGLCSSALARETRKRPATETVAGRNSLRDRRESGSVCSEAEGQLHVAIAGVFRTDGAQRLLDVIPAKVMARTDFDLGRWDYVPSHDGAGFLAELPAEVRADRVTRSGVGGAAGAGDTGHVIPAVGGAIEEVRVPFKRHAHVRTRFE